MTNQIDTNEIFNKVLAIAALLPKPSKHLQKNYRLSRKQIYLIFLVEQAGENTGADPKNNSLSYYAHLLNISNSTLTRNIQKLEKRKIMERVVNPGKKQMSLKLLSLGQLYAIEIKTYIEEHFRNLAISEHGDTLLKLP